MPGYALWMEANPQLEHPIEWMDEYAPKEKRLENERKLTTKDGRPLSQFYYQGDEVQGNKNEDNSFSRSNSNGTYIADLKPRI